jgi:hypothetical protein
VTLSYNGKQVERSVKKLWLKTFGGETMEGVGGEWRAHPDGLYPAYLFSSKGRVWHKPTKGMLKGNKSNGYVRVSTFIKHIEPGRLCTTFWPIYAIRGLGVLSS